MHYYQHHIGDFIKDTSFLTNEEVGIYLKLLWLYYDTERPLPNKIFELSMKVGARDQQEALEGILEMFFTLEGDEWRHSRCAAEIAHYKQQLETASKAGKASAAKRAMNKTATPVERPLNEKPTDEQPTNNHKPIPNNQGEAASPPTRPAKKVTLTTYMANCKAAGTKPIPDDHYVRDYAKDAGIADEMLQVNWEAFKARYLAEKKLYSDWPKVFATSVKERWFKLWFPGDDGLAAWTSTGMQEKQVLEKRMKEAK